jgi:hypothetical protein
MKIFILIFSLFLILCDRDIFKNVINEMNLQGKEQIDKNTFKTLLEKYIRQVSENNINYLPKLYERIIQDISGEIKINELYEFLSFNRLTSYMAEIYMEDMQQKIMPNDDL